jgi:hypothetical protein
VIKGKIKKIIIDVFGRSFHIPSHITSIEENAFLSELQATFRGLPVLETKDELPSAKIWLSNINRLREHVLTKDPRDFLLWDVILRTMFVSSDKYIYTELKYLRRCSNWNTRWRKAIIESSIGHPIPYIYYPRSSGNLIHHAYHLAQFEEKTEMQIQNMDYVFEFGGGYGSMCRLFYNLGFRGSYIIYDLPSFSAIQLYYLRNHGLSVKTINEYLQLKTGIVCISDIRQLTTLLNDQLKTRHTMFVATWSLSESPIKVRNKILSLASDYKSFLIAYQDKFGEVNNIKYFNKWKKTIKNVTWINWQIEHIPRNNYLIGRINIIE